MQKLITSLRDVYRFPGFEPRATVTLLAHDPDAIVLSLRRRKKRPTALSATSNIPPDTTLENDSCVISQPEIAESTCVSHSGELPALGVV